MASGRMKFPKSFRPEKDLECKTKRLVEGSDIVKTGDSDRVADLIESCQYFLELKDATMGPLELDSMIYNLGEDVAKDYYYTKYDLEFLAEEMIEVNDGEHHIGFYLSALINKIIQPDDVITLNITEEVDGLGTKLQHGTLIVNGDVGDDVGHAMAGGKLIVKGNIASSVGYCMEGGEIHINGCMEDFQEDSILKGKLYHRGKLIVSK